MLVSGQNPSHNTACVFSCQGQRVRELSQWVLEIYSRQSRRILSWSVIYILVNCIILFYCMHYILLYCIKYSASTHFCCTAMADSGHASACMLVMHAGRGWASHMTCSTWSNCRNVAVPKCQVDNINLGFMPQLKSTDLYMPWKEGRPTHGVMHWAIHGVTGRGWNAQSWSRAKKWKCVDV